MKKHTYTIETEGLWDYIMKSIFLFFGYVYFGILLMLILKDLYISTGSFGIFCLQLVLINAAIIALIIIGYLFTKDGQKIRFILRRKK